MCKSKQLESTFTEVFQNKEKIVIGCIYKHPSMEFSKFNNHYFTNSLSSENKKVVLLEGFNADLLKHDNDSNVSDFLDAMYSNSFLLNIASPTRIITKSKTLIDNIFTNTYDPFFLSGSIVTTLSDQKVQFSLMEFETRRDGNKNTKIYRDFDEIEKNRNFTNDQLKLSLESGTTH